MAKQWLGKRRISPFVVSVFRSLLRYTALRAALRTNGKCIEPYFGLVRRFPNIDSFALGSQFRRREIDMDRRYAFEVYRHGVTVGIGEF